MCDPFSASETPIPYRRTVDFISLPPAPHSQDLHIFHLVQLPTPYNGPETLKNLFQPSATPAGYSGKATWKKLGIKPGQSLTVLGAPSDYTELIGGLPDGALLSPAVRGSPAFVHLFVSRKKELERLLSALVKKIPPNATIWVSWPKRAAKMDTDITEDTIRDVALPLGLVDIKVCAVNDIWSGLKLVIRKSNRPG